MISMPTAIAQVSTFEAEIDSQWCIQVLRAMKARLGWASISTALDIFERQTAFVGSNDGYNMHAKMVAVVRPYSSGVQEDGTVTEGRFEWEVTGGCGYGSRIHVRLDRVAILSCGGHWVMAEFAAFGAVKWSTDTKPSFRSWGDSPQGEEDPPDMRTPEEILANRCASLEEAYRKVCA